MASKDILDQIRDLQSFIDDFVADAGAISPALVSPQEKTELVLAEPLTKETILQKPDEKTEIEEPENQNPVEEVAVEKEMTAEVIMEEEKEAKVIIEEETSTTKEEPAEEKVLVETSAATATAKTAPQPPLTILSYDLNLSDDFSSLLAQFTDIKVSPIDVNMFKKQQTFLETPHTNAEGKEKTQVDVASTNMMDNTTTTTMSTPTAAVPSTPKLSNNSFLLNDLPSSNNSNGKSRSRRTSVSSKKSRSSAKSAKSARSARRLQNEKKLQQQQKQQQQHQNQSQHQSQKYVERSYDEMMRIPDIYERVAFYEKTLDLCLKAESPISNWCQKNKENGKPQPLLEGYVPPVRLLSPEQPLSENAFGSMSTTFSGSISMFLKKAGGGSQIISKKNNVLENKSFLVTNSSSTYTTPQTPSNYSLTSSTGLFGRSISRLNLSRSTQIPRYDNSIKTPAATRLNPLYNTNRVSSAGIPPPTPKKKRSSINTMNKALTPLNMDYNSRSSRGMLRTPKLSSSTPSSFGSTTTINSQGEFTSQSCALNYMVNILPQVDLRILQNALDEAKGDPMVAISIAVSQNKLASSSNDNDVRRASKKSFSSRNSSSRHYKVK